MNKIPVLYVDGGGVDKKSIQDILSDEKLSFALDVVGSVAEAKSVGTTKGYGLVLIDYQLGDGTALDLLGVFPEIPLIVLIDVGREATAIEALQKGAYDFLIKDSKRNYLKVLPVVVQSGLNRHHAEKEFSESEDRYRELFENSSDLIQSMSPEGYLLYVNKAWLDKMGFARDEVSGKKASEVVTRELKKEFEENFSQCREEKEYLRIETQFLTKEGTTIPIEGMINCRRKHGRPIAVQGIFRDVSSRKEVERMKDAFISTVSHELRTPLTVIREVIAQMLEGILGATTDKQNQFLTHVLENVDRLGLIINDLLDISKIEAGKMQLYLEDFDLTDVARDVVELFSPVAAKKGIELRVQEDAGAVMVFADRDKVIQVLDNLIGNALKFTKEGCVEVRPYHKGEFVECAISDTGPGMTPEDLERVFNKFQQFGRADSGGQKGTGLGLAICKGIAELHQGSIRVDSELNKGTTFTFLIPMKKEIKKVG